MVKRTYIYAIVVILIMAVVAVLVATTGKALNANLTSYDNKVVPQSLIGMLSISNTEANQIGIGVSPTNNVHRLDNSPITLNGKPEVLYIGAEYCPFCAAERWAMVISLMRFGNFTNLRYMTSDPNDYAPSTPTFTFYNSTYYSPYISFVSVEQTTNNRTPLQQPNTSEAYLYSRYDPNGGIPYMLFANRTFLVNASYDPLSILGGKNWTTIASLLHNSSSVQAEAIVGTANLLTAQICAIDNNTPSSVCSQPYVKSLEPV